MDNKHQNTSNDYGKYYRHDISGGSAQHWIGEHDN